MKRIDEVMASMYGVRYLGSYEAVDHPETGGSVRVYESLSGDRRMLVERDPDGKYTVYSHLKSLGSP